jgi:phosphohistidine swiveling domain-containing protein
MTELVEYIGGKARNLLMLREVPGIRVPQFIVLAAEPSPSEDIVAVEQFLLDSGCTGVAVRSSAMNEDSMLASYAGMYLTKLHVPAVLEEISMAISEVRGSGAKKKNVLAHYASRRHTNAGSDSIAVIIQEMIEPDVSGVILSHSLSAQDGYYLISTTEGLGEAVVSGATNGQLIRVARALDVTTIEEDWLVQLITAMRIIETSQENLSLDVEFVFKDQKLYILQCRPIATMFTTTISSEDEAQLLRQLVSIKEDVNVRFDGDLLGDMIDINPLELLGSAPTPLDISIFQHLFADTVVEQVRRDMGYDPLDIGLVRVVAAKPYVSLRASSFSFRPKGITSETYERIFEVYRQMLTENPRLQSRVEFSVFAMSNGEKLEQLMLDGKLTDKERAGVRFAFQQLEQRLVLVSGELMTTYEQRVPQYVADTERLRNGTLQEILAHVTKGTEMFVCAARLAFYWKNKFEESHPREDLNELIVGNINSVSGQLKNDLFACAQKSLSREELVKKYGHLRPGQFSIFGESYADDPEHYLFAQIDCVRKETVPKRSHSFETLSEFKNVVFFMQAREEIKFLFSESLHVFIEKLKTMIEERGLSRDLASQQSWDGLHAFLTYRVSNLSESSSALAMILPEVLVPGRTNFGVISYGAAAPTYITRSVVKARLCVLDHPDDEMNVSGAVVLIPNADPGYDFLFHSQVAGIITKNGGPASHMCIRAVELQVPSCIGCGERIYSSLVHASLIVLDCALGQIILPE